MQQVLVTGGAGFIGSHICKALALAGYTPIAFDNLLRVQEQLDERGLEAKNIRDIQRQASKELIDEWPILPIPPGTEYNRRARGPRLKAATTDG